MSGEADAMPGPLVNVAHPSPVRHLAAGGRVPQDAFERVETTVRIAVFRDADLVPAREASAAAGLPHPYEFDGLHHAGGHLWCPVRIRNRTDGPVTSLSPEEFLAFLDGTGKDVAGRISAAFRWTPLVACHASAGGTAGRLVRHERGADVRRVVEEDRARSALAMAEYMSRDVMVTGSRVLVRVVACRRLSRGHAVPVALPPGGDGEDWALPFAREDFPAAARILGPAKGRRRTALPVAVAGEGGGEEVVVGVNVLARRVDAFLGTLGEKGGFLPGAGVRGFREVRDAYAGWCRRSRMGALRAGDTEPFLDAVRDLERRLLSVVPPSDGVRDIGGLAARAARLYLPRLAAGEAPTGDDLAALAAIAV